MKRNALCIVSSRHDETRKEMQRTSRRKRKETTRRYMAAHSCFRFHAYVSEASVRHGAELVHIGTLLEPVFLSSFGERLCVQVSRDHCCQCRP